MNVWDQLAEAWAMHRQKPWPEVFAFLKNKKGKLLDIGCGVGRHSILAKKMGFNVYSLDISKKMIKYAKKKAKKENLKIHWVVGSASNLPFKTNSFDVVLCIAVIHVLKEEERIDSLKEIERVLKKDGTALISVWNKYQPKFLFKPKEIFVPWNFRGKIINRYYYLFSKKEIINLIKKYTKLKIIKTYPEKNFKPKIFGIFSKNIFIEVKK